ncbi:MAG: glycosyltransferase family 2 protein [Bacteroidaceae bacterium]|nr:glycosyltransferase family 2 protein [Bacteroidaceae bacterium]
MFLSIIIPHYNLSRDLLDRCLKSIALQGLSNEEHEVIVVDDGSIERPYWITEQYNGTILINAEHGGLGHARNIGMEKAKGEYILFIDSDDYLQPDSLKKCIEKLKDEKAQILRFKFKRSDGKRVRTKSKSRYTISGATYMSENNLPGCVWSYIFSRSLANKHNIRFQCGVYHEDEEFTTKLHFHATSLTDSEITAYNYYIRPGSIVQSEKHETKEKRLNDILSILENIKSFKDHVYKNANNIQRNGIDRKLTMLTVDAILNMLYMGKSAKEIYHTCNNRLREAGLYPLPPKRYTLKYRIFRIFANSRTGIKLLRIFINKN